MKFDVLRSIGHNIADSLASGVGLMIGVYDMDVFGEAKASPQGFIEVDFLRGTASGGAVSPALAEAIRLYGQALPELCAKHGATVDAFRELTARYHALGPERRFDVTLTDASGRRVTDAYAGVPGVRIRTLDGSGRARGS